MVYILIAFAIIEIIACFVAIKEIYTILTKKVAEKLDCILDRCVYDIEYRNNIASKIFFLQEMGPGISGFTIISLIMNEGRSIKELLVVFILGIVMKEKSRKLKNLFYSEIKKRSDKCQ